jgi:transposase InsO family protein
VLRRPPESAQCLSIRYTERLDAAGAVRSVGSKGDSFDNAAAESLIGLYKTELIRRRGPWRGLDDVEVATLKMGRLVQSPPPALRLRRHPAHRVRGQPLPFDRRPHGRPTGSTEPPSNPARFRRALGDVSPPSTSPGRLGA